MKHNNDTAKTTSHETLAGIDASRKEPTGFDLSALDEALKALTCQQAPEGLEDRIEARLRQALAAERTHTSLLQRLQLKFAELSEGLQANWMQSNALRGSMAVLLAALVIGSGYQIANRSNTAQSPALAPTAPQSNGGFNSAGAVRTPHTIDGPLLPTETPAANAAQPQVASAAKAKPATRAIKTKKKLEQPDENTIELTPASFR